jgi:cytoskeletal protein RodZ
VDIGGALAEARSEAGLTITEVSQRTRIRETIIRDIERDDYSACGGDYYARGHIRAIARAVGTDPAPLIEEYDAARMPPPPEPAGQNGSGAGHPDGAGWRVPGWARRPAAAMNGNGVAGYSAPSHPAAAPADPGPPVAPAPTPSPAAARPAGPAQYGITAAEAFRPSMPLQHLRTRRRPNFTVILAVIVVVVVGVLAYLLASGGSAKTSPPPKAKSHHTTAPRTHPSASPSATTVVTAPVALPIRSATAFGPAGTADGDNPSEAALAINGNSSTSWQTDWYSSSNFSGLQPGTGLLLDLGSQVSVDSAQLTLGPTPGGSLELLAGNTLVRSAMQVVATAQNPGGTLTLRVTSPVKARYLLIWFTSLPPDSTGTYQASVSDVKLTGTTQP